MSKIMDELYAEAREEAKLETAQNMLFEGDSVEKITRCTGLSLETVQQLAEELKTEPVLQ